MGLPQCFTKLLGMFSEAVRMFSLCEQANEEVTWLVSTCETSPIKPHQQQHPVLPRDCRNRISTLASGSWRKENKYFQSHCCSDQWNIWCVLAAAKTRADYNCFVEITFLGRGKGEWSCFYNLMCCWWRLIQFDASRNVIDMGKLRWIGVRRCSASQINLNFTILMLWSARMIIHESRSLGWIIITISHQEKHQYFVQKSFQIHYCSKWWWWLKCY